MVAILRITEDDFEAALDLLDGLLHSGGLMVYPTDTVYGIGADATSRGAVDRIYAIKGGKERKPMSVMMSGFDMIDDYCETGLWEDIILKKYLPGPYTFIVKGRKPLPVSGTGKLGVRIPDSEFCQALCGKFGKPVVTTSANLSGRPPAAKLEDVDKGILDAVGIAIDGGITKYRGPSLIVDLVDRKLIRPGGETINLVEDFAP